MARSVVTMGPTGAVAQSGGKLGWDGGSNRAVSLVGGGCPNRTPGLVGRQACLVRRSAVLGGARRRGGFDRNTFFGCGWRSRDGGVAIFRRLSRSRVGRPFFLIGFRLMNDLRFLWMRGPL